MPEVDNGIYRTHYEDAGAPRSAGTVLIQHGFGRNSAFWDDWVPPLAGDARVVRRDLRGHGGSGDGGGAPWTFDGLVDDLARFIEALALPDVHLVGESTGGMLAVGLAARRPELLGSLTLCATPATIGPAGRRFFAGEHGSWQEALRALGSEGWGRWLLAQPGTFPSDDPERREWAARQFGRASVDALVGYSEVISATDVTPLLAELTVPALVLAPTRSAATSLAEQRAIAARLPDARLVPVNGAGHEIYVDRAAECIAALREHIAAVVSRPGGRQASACTDHHPSQPGSSTSRTSAW